MQGKGHPVLDDPRNDIAHGFRSQKGISTKWGGGRDAG